MLDEEIKKYQNGLNRRAHGPNLPVNAESSQVPQSKSDLAKKLDVVFHNIRQNKLREEQKALVFQQKGANKKRKQRADKGKKRKEPSVQRDGDSSFSSGEDDLAKVDEKTAKNCKKRPKLTVESNDSDSSDFLDNLSPIKPKHGHTGTSPTNNSNGERSNYFEAAKPAERRLTEREPREEEPIKSIDTPNGKTSTQIPSKKTPISTRTMNKLKMFTFKSPTSPVKEAKLNSPPASESPNLTINSQNSSKSNSANGCTINTQSSIFCIGNDDADSDYDL